MPEQRKGKTEDIASRIVDEHAPDAADVPRKSVATRLVELALAGYTLGCTPDGEPYAIPLDGPPVVRLLRGGRGSLRAELARAYFDATVTAASQSALADACAVIEGRAQRVVPVELHLRVAADADRLVLDLGDQSGRAIVIDPDGWRLVTEPPVRFRRTALTGPLPEPATGGDLAELWSLVNVAERYRPVLTAVLVAELMPAMPHPVLLLSGEQGTGKSTATKMLAAIVDPSPAQLRKPPRDAEAATTAAAGSWIVALDNLSGMPDWLSDCLCRWSTGDGDVRRRLYTDGDLHVIAFRRVSIINGIDLGALRGDLADRAVQAELDRIPDTARREDSDVATQWADAHPRVLGALLDLTACVLRTLPSVQLDEMPRMADFTRVLATVDQILGTKGMTTYLGLRDAFAEDAITSDPVLIALTKKIKEPFTGTSAELLAKITPAMQDGKKGRTQDGWPANARNLTTVLRRQAPTLRRLNWTVTELERESTRAKVLRWHLNPPSESKQGQPSGDQDDDGQRTCANDAA